MSSAENRNVVDWTLSGSYDEHRPVSDEGTLAEYETEAHTHQILIDADKPARSVSRNPAKSLVSRLAGAFAAGSVVCIHAGNDA